MSPKSRTSAKEVSIAASIKPRPSAPPREVTGIALDWLFDTPSFRLTRWSCLVRERSVTPERQQFWHVIGFPHAGSYLLHAEGDSALIDANTVAFFNPLGVYRTSHPNGCGDHGVGLVVAPDVIADAISDWNPGVEDRDEALFPELSSPSTPRAYWIQNRILSRALSGTPADALEIEEAGLELVAEAVSSLFRRTRSRIPARTRTARRQREGVRAARSALGRRFRENIQLEDVASAAQLSIFHLCRTFRSETGISIHRYLHRLRLRTALASLPDYRRDLTRLALDLGYSSHSHFTSAFRREFGLTPSAAGSLRSPASLL